MAPDSNTLTRLPPGPSGSTIAGILLLGLIARNAGAICSPLLMLTGKTLYGSPISSSATLILRPFGVFQVWSSMVILLFLPRSVNITYPGTCRPYNRRFHGPAHACHAVDGATSALECAANHR